MSSKFQSLFHYGNFDSSKKRKIIWSKGGVPMTGTQIFLLVVFGFPIIFAISNAISDKRKKKEQEASHEEKRPA